MAYGYPIDAALAEGRKAILATVEWGTPVLYLRAPDGRIFDVEPLSEDVRKRVKAGSLDRKARDALNAEDWATAVNKLRALCALQPDHTEAANLLRQAQGQQELADLFARGQEYYRAQQWDAALVQFEQVQVKDPNYMNVFILIDRCKARLVPPTPSPVPTPRPPDPADPYTRIATLLAEGRVIPFLGTDVNLCSRPREVAWQSNQAMYLPSSDELAAALAVRFGLSPPTGMRDLESVSQYAAIMQSSEAPSIGDCGISSTSIILLPLSTSSLPGSLHSCAPMVILLALLSS